MIAKLLTSATVAPLVFLAGCSSLTPTENGVLGGGALGAGVGAIVGHALHNTAAGAVIGGATGAVTGGLVGNSVEKREQRTQAEIAAAEARAQAQYQLGIADVIQMVHSHVDDTLIISQIRSSGSIFHLSAQDVVMLKQNGVSDAVVQEMQASAYRAPRRVYTAAPVYAPASSVYVVEPAPVVGVGFGYGYGPRYRRW